MDFSRFPILNRRTTAFNHCQRFNSIHSKQFGHLTTQSPQQLFPRLRYVIPKNLTPPAARRHDRVTVLLLITCFSSPFQGFAS